MAKNERWIVGLDVGSTKVSCVVGELTDEGRVQLQGVGNAPCRGLRKGIVVNMDATVDAIKRAVDEAEAMAGMDVETVAVGLSGPHVRSFNSRGVVTATGRDRTVTRDDVKRVMEAAKAVSIPAGHEILHVLPQEYVLDDQRIENPVGLVGQRLEANVHIVTASTTAIQNLVTCVNRAGMEVRDTVLEQLAIAASVLSEDERDLGVAMIDVGGGTADVAILERGSIWHTAVLPVGGDHFTNDLAVGLRAPIPEAERLKKRYGCAMAGMVDADAAVEVPTVGGRKPRLLSLQVMAEILEPRAEEIFKLIRDEIARAGFDKTLNAGIVLSGGGSLLPGMAEMAEQVFELPVRIGQAMGAHGELEGSGWNNATAIGLALYAARHSKPRRSRGAGVSAGMVGRMSERVKTWFSEVF